MVRCYILGLVLDDIVLICNHCVKDCLHAAVLDSRNLHALQIEFFQVCSIISLTRVLSHNYILAVIKLLCTFLPNLTKLLSKIKIMLLVIVA